MMMTAVNTNGKMVYGGQVTPGYCFLSLNCIVRTDLICCSAATFVEI